MIIPHVGEGVEKNRHCHSLVGVQIDATFPEGNLATVKLRKIANLCDAAIPLLGRLP